MPPFRPPRNVLYPASRFVSSIGKVSRWGTSPGIASHMVRWVKLDQRAGCFDQASGPITEPSERFSGQILASGLVLCVPGVW